MSRRISTLLTLLPLVAAPAFAVPQGDWEFIATPSGDALRDVAVVASDDVWAVGSQDGPFGNPTIVQVQHFDGSSWSVVPTPIPGVRSSRLAAVAAVSANDVWAVGRRELQTPPFGSVKLNVLVMRWDGTDWEVMDTPTVGGSASGAVLYDIEIVAPDDIWFGGEWSGTALAMHWDGTDFEIYPTPTFGNGGGTGTFGDGHSIEALSALGPDDIWAVGGAGDGDFAGDESNIFHWNGSVWQHVPGPTAPGDSHRLFEVVALATDDVWALGSTSQSGPPFVLHWDGAQWTRDPVSSFAHPNGGLHAATAFAPDDIWAAGVFTLNPLPDVVRPLLMHFDGTAWTQVASDPSGPALGWFRGLDHLGDDAWVVGSNGSGSTHAQRLVRPDSFCSGDGGDQLGCTNCPCGNDAAPGATGGCLNESGTSARILRCGSPSVAADTLRFEITGANPATFAVLVSGAQAAPANPANPCFGQDSGIQSPAFNGLRCVVQDLRRHGARATDALGGVGAATPGWGAPDGPQGGIAQNGGFVAGQTRYFQAVYRESPGGSCATGQNTSDATTVMFLP